VNARYTGTFVFDNDHPCVGAGAPRELSPPSGIYRNRPATGAARVVCYSPRHDVTLADLNVDSVDALLETWQQQMRELATHPDVAFVLIFENKGEVVGVSNPHPHCQIYATNFTFKYVETELLAGRRHLEETGRILFDDVLKAEQQDGRRILIRHGSAIAFVPYFARYAYETYVAPLRSVTSVAELDDDERRDLATVLRDVVIRFDNLWQMPFPYVMALHQAPVKGDVRGFHFHIEFHPPLRRPNLLKYLAGPEIGGGNFLSDTSPEEKAAELIDAGGPHYRSTAS
jgi:UDPglucose--hexose-1-phosphate uridylyltransferase